MSSVVSASDNVTANCLFSFCASPTRPKQSESTVNGVVGFVPLQESSSTVVKALTSVIRIGLRPDPFTVKLHPKNLTCEEESELIDDVVLLIQTWIWSVKFSIPNNVPWNTATPCPERITP